ncbi:MAG: hydrogenase maturation nickel metallochaperone HypA [Nitrospira sp.]|nr:hydrogenase maturation nickel metallochaperone HypA [Nitrospira sp.]
MHELHLMRQVVKAVEARLDGTGDTKLSAVRLKVSALSHLLIHDHDTLQTTFRLAARGTKAEGAALEILTVPGEAWCPQCRRDVSVEHGHEVCPACGEPVIAVSTESDVIVHELVVQE